MNAPVVSPVETPPPAPPLNRGAMPRPLLPSLLTQPSVFLWLWLLPIGILLVLNWQGYWLVEGNMTPPQRTDAWTIGLAGLADAVLGAVCFGLTRMRRGARHPALGVHPAWGVVATAVQVAYLWIVLQFGDRVVPWDVATWIYPSERFFFNQFAFAMLPLFHGILLLAGARPAAVTWRAILVSAGAAIGAPILFYAIMSALDRIRYGDYEVAAFVLIVGLAVVAGVVMFFGLSRAVVPFFSRVPQEGARPARPTGRGVLLNTSAAIAAPILFYAITVVVLKVFGGSYRVDAFVGITGFVALGLVMFLGLVRALLLAIRKAHASSVAAELFHVAFATIVLPVAGLLLNRAIPFPVDFQAWEVYTLVGVNAAILLGVTARHARAPELSFCLLCATLPFSLYFFLVLLPYLPLAIIAVLAMGTGFLILSPTILFVTHLYLLQKVRRHPRLAGLRPARLALMGGLSFAALPLFFVGRAWADRVALRGALDHAFAPAIDGKPVRYGSSRVELRRALTNHRAYKDGIYYPMLSDFYGWFVFDQLVLPDEKLDQLERLFFGAASPVAKPVERNFGFGLWSGRGHVRDRVRAPTTLPWPRNVRVEALDLRTTPLGAGATRVTFALTLRTTGPGNAEYLQSLPLPAGVQVDGFRLHLHGQLEPGRIFEKKTALWVYSMIRNEQRPRDPGLLFYRAPDELELRVFPVVPDVPSIVEIDFLVPGRVAKEQLPKLTRDPAVMLKAVGWQLTPQLTHATHGSVATLGAVARDLPEVDRASYLHVIVDRSRDNGFEGDLGAALRALTKEFPYAPRARISAANFDVVDLVNDLTSLNDLAARPPDLGRALPLEGGFAADVAFARALRRHRDADLDAPALRGQLPATPILVILSASARPRELATELTEKWSDLVPGLEIREFGADGTSRAQRHAGQAYAPLLRLGRSVRPLLATRPVRFAPAAPEARLECWWPRAGEWRPIENVTTQPAASPWSVATELQLQAQDQARSPRDAEEDLPALVALSRSTGVLLPATSYIVVENAAQWRMLEQSEKQKLKQNAALAFRETPAPPALLVALALAAWIAGRRWWQRRSRSFGIAT